MHPVGIGAGSVGCGSALSVLAGVQRDVVGLVVSVSAPIPYDQLVMSARNSPNPRSRCSHGRRGQAQGYRNRHMRAPEPPSAQMRACPGGWGAATHQPGVGRRAASQQVSSRLQLAGLPRASGCVCSSRVADTTVSGRGRRCASVLGHIAHESCSSTGSCPEDPAEREHPRCSLSYTDLNAIL